MGLNAQLIAIGPFSSGVVLALEYGPDAYSMVPPGSIVVSNVFIAETSDASHRLAAAFGVGAMELGRHKLDASHANTDALIDLFGEEEVAQFQCLVRHGFTFYFLPNA